MYNNAITGTSVAAGVGTVAGGGTVAAKTGAGHAVSAAVHGSLAFTGLNTVYLVCGAFALIAAGLAILRIAPRFQLARIVPRLGRK